MILFSLLMTSCSTCRLIEEHGDPSYGSLSSGDRLAIRTVQGEELVFTFESASRDTLFGWMPDTRVSFADVASVESIERCSLDIGKTARRVGAVVLVLAGFVGMIALGHAGTGVAWD